MSLAEDYRERAAPWSDIQDCLERLYSTAVSYPAVKVLELGVRSGVSTAAFLAAAEQVGGHVWSVDIAPPQVPTDRWLDSGFWSLAVGDDMQIPGSPRLFDVLFIDTSHAYAHTLAELRKFVPMVAPGGTVFCHDTRLEAPELVGPQPPFPVARALDAFCAETGRSWADHDAQYGLGEIVKPNG
jgi:predicted O-methyltransferase YrrM